MKAIATEITWFFVIGIAALIIATSIFLFWRENIVNFFYCELYQKIFFSHQIDEKCKREFKLENIKIDSQNEKEIINLFTSYLIKCWLDAEKYKNFKTHFCYKISFRNDISLRIFPQNISEVLKTYDNCKTLQYKNYTCGYRDDIEWSVNKDYISENDIVLIKYLENDKIEIIV